MELRGCCAIDTAGQPLPRPPQPHSSLWRAWSMGVMACTSHSDWLWDVIRPNCAFSSTSSHGSTQSNRAACIATVDSDIPISGFAPWVGKMPVVQQYIDASIGTLYCIYWVIIYQDFGTQLPATWADGSCYCQHCWQRKVHWVLHLHLTKGNKSKYPHCHSSSCCHQLLERVFSHALTQAFVMLAGWKAYLQISDFDLELPSNAQWLPKWTSAKMLG